MKCPSHDIVVELAFALANGEGLSPELAQVRAHGHECEACAKLLRSTVHALRATRELLCPPDHGSRPLRGDDCLDDNLLAEYLDGTLSPAARDAAEAHLARCIHCLRELAELSDVSAATEEGNSPALADAHGVPLDGTRPLRAAVRYVLRVASDGLEWLERPCSGFSLIPAAGGLLGPEAASPVLQRSWSWIQESDDRRLRFHVTQVTDDALNMAIRLDADVPLRGARLCLSSEGQVIQSESFTSAGDIMLSGLALGEYSGEVTYSSGDRVHFEVAFRAQE